MTDYLAGYAWGLLLILIGFTSACVPTRPVTFTTDELVIGTKIITEDDVSAVVYEFSNRINSVYLDTLSGLFTLQFRDLNSSGNYLRNLGRIMVFNPDNSSVYWDKPISYNKESYLQVGPNLIKYTSTGGNFINQKTGQPGNRIQYLLYHIDSVHNIGMGYRISSSNRHRNTLFGVDMTSGKELWRRPINSEYSWNELEILNDTTTVLVAGGIHTIDPRDGSGWSFDSITGKKDYTAAIAGTIAGIAAGLLTGHYYVATGHTLIADIVSNLLIDENSLTLATAEKLVKLDYSGENIWSSPLDQKEASLSQVWEEDGLTFLINTGYAYSGYFRIPIGKPFLAAFDSETGNEIYKTYLSDDKEFIRGQIKSGDTVLLLFMNRIEQYNLSDGEKINSRLTDEYEKGALSGFVGFQAFRKDDESTYYSITSLDLSNNYIITSERQILVLDNTFNYVDTIGIDELFLLKSAGEDHFVISNYENTKSVMLDNQMMAITEINIGGRVIRNRDLLYFVDDHKMVKINLTDAVSIFNRVNDTSR